MMRTSVSNMRYVMGAVIGLLLGSALYVSPVLAEPEKESQPLLPLHELRVFTTVFDHIKKLYVDEVDDKTLLENAVRGMLQELDPHSVYLDEKKFADLQENTTGEFAGLGIEVGMEDGFVRVIAPIDDTPAQRAGIRSGDLITRIDNESVKGLSLDQAVEKMRGEKGSSVVLTIFREGIDQPFEVTIIRDIVTVRSVRSREISPGFLYIRLAQFQQKTGAELVQAIASYRAEQEIRGVVLDLRDNPGGLLQAAVDVADAFLDQGLIVYTKGRVETANDLSYSATEGDLVDGAPIVIMTNGGSASASEIVAGALQDHKRAILVGTRSFGKGSVQTVIPVSESQAIKLTTALYYTPSGRSIQAEGISPDIRVALAQVHLKPTQGEEYSEASLQGHLENRSLQQADKADASAGQDDAVNIEQDNQLYEAFNILQAVALMNDRKALPVPASAD